MWKYFPKCFRRIYRGNLFLVCELSPRDANCNLERAAGDCSKFQNIQMCQGSKSSNVPSFTMFKCSKFQNVQMFQVSKSSNVPSFTMFKCSKFCSVSWVLGLQIAIWKELGIVGSWWKGGLLHQNWETGTAIQHFSYRPPRPPPRPPSCQQPCQPPPRPPTRHHHLAHLLVQLLVNNLANHRYLGTIPLTIRPLTHHPCPSPCFGKRYTFTFISCSNITSI